MNNRPTLRLEERDRFGFAYGEEEEEVMVRFHLRNGRMVSVIKDRFSLGGPDGLWEAAILSDDGFIIGDVMGYLHPKDVADIVSRTSKL